MGDRALRFGVICVFGGWWVAGGGLPVSVVCESMRSGGEGLGAGTQFGPALNKLQSSILPMHLCTQGVVVGDLYSNRMTCR